MIHWIMAVRCIFQASKDSEAQKYKSRNITSCELLPKTLPQVMLRFRQNLADPQKISDPISPHAHTHPCTPFVAQHVKVFGESFEVVKPLLDIDSKCAARAPSNASPPATGGNVLFPCNGAHPDSSIHSAIWL